MSESNRHRPPLRAGQASGPPGAAFLPPALMRPSVDLPEFRVEVELAADPQRQCEVLLRILRSGSGCAYFSAVCEYCLKASTHKVVRRLAYSVLRGCRSYSGDEWAKLADLVQRDLEGILIGKNPDAEDFGVSALQTLDTLHTVPVLRSRRAKFGETLTELLVHRSVRIRHAAVHATAAFLFSASDGVSIGADQHVRASKFLRLPRGSDAVLRVALRTASPPYGRRLC